VSVELVALERLAELNPAAPRRQLGPPDAPTCFVPMSSVSEEGRLSVVLERPLREVTRDYTYFEQGDVLLAKITPCMENGKAAYLSELPRPFGFGSTEFHVLRPRAGVEGKYLFYLLWNPLFRHQAARSMTGTGGQKRVPTSFLKALQVPLPPREEQRRIVQVLDKADSIRRKRREALGLVDALLQSVFLELFGDPVANPKGWPIRALEELVDAERGISYGIVQRGPDVHDGVPVVRISNFNANRFDDTAGVRTARRISEAHRRTILRGGELVVSIRGTVGRVAVVPPTAMGWNVSREVAVVPLRDGVSRPFVHQALLAAGAQRFMLGKVKGVAQLGINLSDLRRAPIPSPPAEQLARFEAAASRLRRLEEELRRAGEHAETLFASLVEQAFRGPTAPTARRRAGASPRR
jgi:type I restriction enzyme S subunit